MSSSLPEPEPKFSSTLHVVRPGEPSASWDRPSSAAPIQPVSTGAGFLVGWSLFRIAIWAAIALWVNPHLLDLVGGDAIASWLMHHGWVRLLCMPPLGLLGVISVLELRGGSRPRAAREQLATRLGATLLETRHVDPTFGLPDGPGLRVPLGRWSMVVNSSRQNSTTHTVASTTVATRSALSFVARGPDREPAIIRGLQQLVMGHVMRHLGEQASNPRAAAAAATLAYMVEPPIAIGDEALDRAVILRTNQPDAARAMFRDGAVARAIVALNEKSRRWDWTFYPATTAGTAEMRFECPGALLDAESLRAVQAVMQAALESMARTGVIAG